MQYNFHINFNQNYSDNHGVLKLKSNLKKCINLSGKLNKWFNAYDPINITLYVNNKPFLYFEFNMENFINLNSKIIQNKDNYKCILSITNHNYIGKYKIPPCTSCPERRNKLYYIENIEITIYEQSLKKLLEIYKNKYN